MTVIGHLLRSFVDLSTKLKTDLNRPDAQPRGMDDGLPKTLRKTAHFYRLVPRCGTRLAIGFHHRQRRCKTAKHDLWAPCQREGFSGSVSPRRRSTPFAFSSHFVVR